MDFVTKLRDAMNNDTDYVLYEDFSELSTLAEKHSNVGVYGVLEFDGVFMGAHVKKDMSDAMLYVHALSQDLVEQMISDDPYFGAMDCIGLVQGDIFHFWTKTK